MFAYLGAIPVLPVIVSLPPWYFASTHDLIRAECMMTLLTRLKRNLFDNGVHRLRSISPLDSRQLCRLLVSSFCEIRIGVGDKIELDDDA